MSKKKWVGREFTPAVAGSLSKKLNISPLLAKILAGRGFSDPDYVFSFLHPSLKDIPDPFLFRDMNKSVKRIWDAIRRGEKIGIHGDYDVDGITSTAVLYNFFKEIGYERISVYLPSRIGEGYGLSVEAIKKFLSEGVKLIITVDCGSSDIDKIKFAISSGVDVIVTDHHDVPESGESIDVFINPKRKGCSFPFHELAGVGVAFYLIIALRKYLRNIGYFKKIREPNLKKYLDLVAIGTFADVVPLRGVNRVFTSVGLEVLNNTTRPGLVALKEIAEIEDKITPFTVSFVIAPRINASARLGDSSLPLRLLITNSEVEAIKIARELEKRNRERQELQRLTEKEALKMMEEKDLKDRNSLILYNPSWHPGIIGLVAAKLSEKFGKPTFILGKKEDGTTVGSGRTPPGFHLFKTLDAINDLFLSYGGHSLAAGLTIEEDRIPKLVSAFEEYVMKHPLSPPPLYYDADVTLSELTLKDVEALELLEPYGEGNPVPLFKTENVVISKRYFVGQNTHLKFVLSKGKSSISAIAFNWNNEVPTEGTERSFIYFPSINRFSTPAVELVIEDIL